MTRIFARARTGVMLRDVQIPNSAGGYWPHLCDLYIPQGCTITRAVCILHGGGGNKDNMVQSCGLSSTSPASKISVFWDMLRAAGAAVILPQGQKANGVTGPFNPNGAAGTAATWSNGVMWSGVDDKAFLADLSPWFTSLLASQYGSTGTLQRVLFGHSNGGMMAQLIWQEQPHGWDAVGSACGPLSAIKDTSPIVAPSTLLPIYTSWSLGDTVVGVKNGAMGIGNHFWDDTWTESPVYQSEADVAYPANNTFISGWRSFAWQVGLSGQTFSQSDGTSTRQHGGGMLTRWDYGSHRMELLDLGSHSLEDQSAICGISQIRRWFDWALSL